MAMNQIELRINAMKTPGPKPTLAIVRGTTSGKIMAPAKGVTATIKRNIKDLGQKP